MSEPIPVLVAGNHFVLNRLLVEALHEAVGPAAWRVRGLARPWPLASSTVVALHARLTPETAGLIGATELAATRRGSVLVNGASGGLLDQAALAAALREQHLFASPAPRGEAARGRRALPRRRPTDRMVDDDWRSRGPAGCRAATVCRRSAPDGARSPFVVRPRGQRRAVVR